MYKFFLYKIMYGGFDWIWFSFVLLFFVVSLLMFSVTSFSETAIVDIKDKSVISVFIKKGTDRALKFKQKMDKIVKKDLMKEGSAPVDVFDYGVIGNLFEINDPNIIEWGAAMVSAYMRKNPLTVEKIQNQAFSVDLKFPRTKTARSYKVNMSVTLKEDKYVEMGPDFGGKRLLAKKGTVINPLELMTYPYTLWFLTDKDDYYLDQAMKDKLSMIVITNGNLKDISDKHPGIQLSKATLDILYRLVIRSVPAKTTQCAGEPLMCVDLLEPVR